MVALLAMLPLSAQVRDDPSPSSVTVLAYSNQGTPQPRGKLKITNAAGKTIINDPVELPYRLSLAQGTYRFHLEATFFEDSDKTVQIREAKQAVVLGLEFADSGHALPSKASITIAISGGAGCGTGPRWVRLSSAYSGESVEQVLSPLGYALFESLNYGAYVMTVVQGKRILLTKALDTMGTETVHKFEAAPCLNP